MENTELPEESASGSVDNELNDKPADLIDVEKYYSVDKLGFACVGDDKTDVYLKSENRGKLPVHYVSIESLKS